MNREEISATVRRVITDHFASTGHRKQPGEITDATSLVDDLGVDSLDSIEITLELETAFDVEISDAEAEELKTFGQMVDWLRAKLGAQAVTA